MTTTLKPRVAHVTIFQGDDMATLSDLRRTADQAERLAAANTGSPLRLGDVPDTAAAQEARDAYDAFVDEAAERAVVVELQSIGRRRFRDLMTAHPPRMVKVKADPDPEKPDGPVVEHEETHEDDAQFGVNSETFPDALLTFIDPDDPKVRTITAPEFTSAKTTQAFLDDDIADGDYDGLWVTALLLNRRPSADPESSRYSAPRPSTAETSK